MRSAIKSAGFYALWYPRQWLPFGATLPADIHPHFASHLRTVERRARKMARTLFHQMVIFGPKLEKRQVLLGRIADIGSDLFALAASCIYGQKLLKDGEPEAKVFALVDDFAAQALLRIDGNFRGVGHNADQQGYELAQQIVAGEHTWLEQGIL